MLRNIFVLTTALALSASPASAREAEECAAALLPQISVINTSLSQQLSYLHFVNRENFESARNSASGGGSYLGIIEADMSFDEFEERRTRFFEQSDLSFSSDEAVAVFRRTLSPDQLDAWKVCMTDEERGVRLIIGEELEQGANFSLTYSGDPGTSQKVSVRVQEGGSVVETIFFFWTRDSQTATFDLPHDGEESFFVRRASPDATIILTANALNSSSSDRAISFASADPWASAPEQELPPRLARNLAKGMTTQTNIPGRPGPEIVDDDEATVWNAGRNVMDGGPVWVEIDLGAPRTVTQIVLIPVQSPETSDARHRVRGERETGEEIELHLFAQKSTSRVPMTADLSGEETRGIRRVRITTEEVYSWVAWSEIRIYGY